MTLSLSAAREAIIELDPCDEAQEWLATIRGVSAAKAYEACPRGDWLLWLAAKAGVDRRRIVLAACDCARLALAHVPEGELRPLRAIETAESWVRGEASVDQVRSHACGAYAACSAADAACSAADAACSAYYAACSAYHAAFWAYAADAAYAAFSADVARATTLRHSAELVRARIPWSVVEAALEASR